jgi:hypothetical protein
MAWSARAAGWQASRTGHRPHPHDVQRLRASKHCHRGHDLRQATRTPLRVWLAAAWYLTHQKQGVSALGLQRVLGLGSYQTAWAMLHRLRRAMVRPDGERLGGTVEVDETYLAITDREEPQTALGRKNDTAKVLLALAVEVLEPRGFGRIRLRRIAEDSQEFVVVPFVQASSRARRCERMARPPTGPWRRSATAIKETSCPAPINRRT